MRRLTDSRGLWLAGRRRHLALAVLVALLAGVWRVPGGWLVLRGIAQDVFNAAPQGYAGALVLVLAWCALAALALRGTLHRPRYPRLAVLSDRGA